MLQRRVRRTAKHARRLVVDDPPAVLLSSTSDCGCRITEPVSGGGYITPSEGDIALVVCSACIRPCSQRRLRADALASRRPSMSTACRPKRKRGAGIGDARIAL